MPITEDVEVLSERLGKAIENVDYYPYQENQPRNEEFGKMAHNGARDAMKMLLSSSVEVFNAVVAHFAECKDQDAQTAYFHGMQYILKNPASWTITPGWDDKVNEI